jgi:hypothetical protein
LIVAFENDISDNKIMQPEDILRLREADQDDQQQRQLEDEQKQLIHSLKQTIKQKTVIATKRFNSVLEQAIQLIKNS